MLVAKTTAGPAIRSSQEASRSKTTANKASAHNGANIAAPPPNTIHGFRRAGRRVPRRLIEGEIEWVVVDTERTPGSDTPKTKTRQATNSRDLDSQWSPLKNGQSEVSAVLDFDHKTGQGHDSQRLCPCQENRETNLMRWYQRTGLGMRVSE